MTWEIASIFIALFFSAAIVGVFWLKLEDTKHHKKTKDEEIDKSLQALTGRVERVDSRLQTIEMMAAVHRR